MMKTWIGPPWTGSVEFATPTQVDISSAIALLPRGIMPRWLGRKQNKCDSYLGTACCSSGDPPRCRTGREYRMFSPGGECIVCEFVLLARHGL